MQTSESVTEIAAALAEFNASVANPVADQLARVKSNRTGSEYTYPYADLGGITDVVRPALAAAGLSVFQEVVWDAARAWVGAETWVWHRSGEWLRFSAVWVPVPDEGSAQDIGKAISYSRRYSYLSSLGLAAREESDGPGGSASGAQSVTRQRRSPRPVPAAEPQTINRGQFEELMRRARAKGRTVGDLAELAIAKGFCEPLPKMPPTLLEYITNRLEALPDVAGDAKPADSPEVAP
jgi:hypothetical protein